MGKPVGLDFRAGFKRVIWVKAARTFLFVAVVCLLLLLLFATYCAWVFQDVFPSLQECAQGPGLQELSVILFLSPAGLIVNPVLAALILWLAARAWPREALGKGLAVFCVCLLLLVLGAVFFLRDNVCVVGQLKGAGPASGAR